MLNILLPGNSAHKAHQVLKLRIFKSYFLLSINVAWLCGRWTARKRISRWLLSHLSAYRSRTSPRCPCVPEPQQEVSAKGVRCLHEPATTPTRPCLEYLCISATVKMRILETLREVEIETGEESSKHQPCL